MTAETVKETEDDMSGDALLVFNAIDLVAKELSPKVDIDVMADAFISVGFDMTMHIADHAMPGKTFDEKSDAVRKHLDGIVNTLTENIWKPKHQSESESE
jgi:hypothetical protein